MTHAGVGFALPTLGGVVPCSPSASIAFRARGRHSRRPHRRAVTRWAKATANDGPASSADDSALSSRQSSDPEKEPGMGPSWPAYAAVFAAQTLPFLSRSTASDIAYFLITATFTLFTGCKRAMLSSEIEEINPRTAAFAPILSSAYLFGIYCLLKYTSIDIGTVFVISSSMFGTLCLASSMRPVFEDLAPAAVREWVLPLPALPGAGNKGTDEPPRDLSAKETPAPRPKLGLLDFGSVAGAVAVAAAYLTHREPNFLFSNMLAWGIAVESLSLLRPSSFVVAAGLLTGLFFYDIFWVFGGDVMVTVATKIDAPAKFLFPKDLSHVSNPSSVYPFAVLGLGDVVVPGLFATLSLLLDKHLVYGEADGGEQRQDYVPSGPYFQSAMWGYLLGLIATFTANSTTSAAQPALLYLVPCLIGSAVITAVRRGELPKLLSFRVPKRDEDPNAAEAD